MAGRRATSKQAEQYILLYSECGDSSQLEVYDETIYHSVKAAKESCKEDATDQGAKMFLVKVVEVGSASGFTWK